MAHRLDIYVDTDHDDEVEAREYVEGILTEHRADPANPDPDQRVLYFEVREVDTVEGYEDEEPGDRDSG